jgi:parvulin-like peptidyl-prolyl isomerase
MRSLPKLLAALLLAACATQPAPRTAPLALVNGEPVTVADLTEQFVKKHGGHTVFLGAEAEARRFLEIIIEDRLLIQEAYNLELQKSPAIAQAVDEYRDRKSVDYLVKTEIEEKSVPTEAELREAWQTQTTALLQVRQILVSSRQEAEEIRAAILHGGDFEAFARECSSSPSNKYGGRLATIGWGSREERWEQVVSRLEPGELSEPIRTKEGWELALLDSREVAALPDFYAARPRLEAILKQRKGEHLRDDLSTQLWNLHGARMIGATPSVSALAALLNESPASALVTWDGGSVSVKELFTPGELRMYVRFAPVRAEDEIDSRIRATVHQRLLALEARARRTANVPTVAEDVLKYQERLMQNALYEDHVLKRVVVTDADIETYYRENQSTLIRPEKRRIAHLVVATEEEAQKWRAQIDGGGDFAALVKEHSADGQTKDKDGDLGWITKKNTPEAFAPVLSLKEGEVSLPIRSEYGWHLIRVSEIAPPTPLTLDEAREDLRKLVTQKRMREARGLWIEKLRQVAEIQVSDKAIRQYVEDHPYEGAPETAPTHGAPAQPSMPAGHGSTASLPPSHSQ